MRCEAIGISTLSAVALRYRLDNRSTRVSAPAADGVEGVDKTEANECQQ